jgi:hypothetical protein
MKLVIDFWNICDWLVLFIVELLAGPAVDAMKLPIKMKKWEDNHEAKDQT